MGVTGKKKGNSLGIFGTAFKKLQELMFPMPRASQQSVFWQSLTGLVPSSKATRTNLSSPQSNTVVAICCNYMATSALGVEVGLNALTGKKSVPVQKHPILDLLSQPNPFWSGSHLTVAVIYSLLTNGNAYVIKRKNRIGEVKELWFAPPHTIEVIPDQKLFIRSYRYTVESQIVELLPEDVIHFRYLIDIDDNTKGVSPLKSLKDEIWSDDEASSFQLNLLSTCGTPSAIISPETLGDFDFSSSDAKNAFLALSPGEPFVINVPLRVEFPTRSPEDLGLSKIVERPEARICAALGVPASLVGLSVGDTQKTYSNYEEARKSFYFDSLMPLMAGIIADYNTQLVKVIDSNLVLNASYDNIPVIQQQIANNITILFEKNLITRSEARAKLGYEVDENRDGVFLSDTKPTLGVAESSNNLPPEPQKMLGKSTKSADFASYTGWVGRIETELEAIEAQG